MRRRTKKRHVARQLLRAAAWQHAQQRACARAQLGRLHRSASTPFFLRLLARVRVPSTITPHALLQHGVPHERGRHPMTRLQ